MDVALLKEVQRATPFALPHGQVTAAWEDVAAGVRRAAGIDVDGRRCRLRYSNLLQTFRRGEADNLRKSGTEEEYSERQQLLQDLNEQEDAATEAASLEKTSQQAKKAKDDTDGARLRENAVKRLRDREDAVSSDDDNLSSSSSSGRTKKRLRTSGGVPALSLSKWRADVLLSQMFLNPFPNTSRRAPERQTLSSRKRSWTWKGIACRSSASGTKPNWPSGGRSERSATTSS